LKENLNDHEYLQMDLTINAIDCFQWAIDKVQNGEVNTLCVHYYYEINRTNNYSFGRFL